MGGSLLKLHVGRLNYCFLNCVFIYMYKLSKSNTVFHFLIYPAMSVFLSATENHSLPVGSWSRSLSRGRARSAARPLRPSGPCLPRLCGTARRDFTGTERPCEEAAGDNGDAVLRQRRRRQARPCLSLSPQLRRAPSFPLTSVIFFCALRAKKLSPAACLQGWVSPESG